MKNKVFRSLFYIVGMLLLAIGLTLNTKTGLGVSAIMMLPYVGSELWDLNFGNAAFVLYGLFVVVQIALHLTGDMKNRGVLLIRDVLQLPVSLLFTRVMNWISSVVPLLSEAYSGRFLGSFPVRVAVLLFAVICTGVGAAMTLNMRLVPNPADGIVQSLAERMGKRIGFVKNCLDLGSVAAACLLGLVFVHSIIGVGVGTLVAALGVGRMMHLFEQLCKDGLLRLAGMAPHKEDGNGNERNQHP